MEGKIDAGALRRAAQAGSRSHRAGVRGDGGAVRIGIRAIARAGGLFVDCVQGYVDRCHNQKEERHLFPRLEAKGMPRHGGPLGVMLQEHERAQEILSRLVPLASAFAAGEAHWLAALCKDHF